MYQCTMSKQSNGMMAGLCSRLWRSRPWRRRRRSACPPARQGGVENRHSTDLDSPPPPPRVVCK